MFYFNVRQNFILEYGGYLRKIKKRKEREHENIFSKGLCNSIDLNNLS